MNKLYIFGGGIIALLIAVFAFSQIQAPSTKQVSVTKTAPQISPAPATTQSSTASPQDIVPGLYPNPIHNTATVKGIEVLSVMVENNVDAAGKPVSDHLQFDIQNLTAKAITDPEVYYTILDTVGNKKEGYYKKLSGITIAPHSKTTVHFDGQSGYGHFPVNMHGIYGTATDQLKFVVEVSAMGYAPVTVSITKAPGGAEVVGQ